MATGRDPREFLIKPARLKRGTLNVHIRVLKAIPALLHMMVFREDLEDHLEGGERLSRPEFENARLRWYQKRGWDPSGRPT
jgi:hypothetical protein